MAYYQRLIDILRVAPHRINEAGEIHLTELEAHVLRCCEFMTAKAGPWKIPQLPEVLVRSNALPLHLAGLPPAVVPRPSPAVVPSAVPPGQGLNCEPVQITFERHQKFAILPRPLKGEAERVARWYRLSATPDQRRVFLSLARCPDGRIRKRRLQQHLHRLPAIRFNEALQGLRQIGMVTQEGLEVALVAGVRTALGEAGLPVSRLGQRRAARPHKRLPRMVCYRTRDGRSRIQPMFVKKRRTLPPVGTSEWGRSMRAKRGGYARYRKCLAFGIHPTAQATAARLARKST